MTTYEATATIDASPAQVWKVLVDAPSYTTWDSGVRSIEGTIAEGEKLKLVSEVNPDRTFSLRVSEFTPPRSMTWTGGMPLGLFKGVRTYTVAPEGAGSTFTMREVYSGPMLRFIAKSIPDLGPSFEQFANGLKAEAERRASQSP